MPAYLEMKPSQSGKLLNGRGGGNNASKQKAGAPCQAVACVFCFLGILTFKDV